MMQKLFVILLSALVFVGCKENANKALVAGTVDEFLGSELRIPSGLQAKINGRDTVCDYLDADLKILVYTDSAGCSPCKMELAAWTLRMEELSTLKLNVPVVFVVYSKDYTELENALQMSYFEYSIFYDTDNKIETLNPKLKDTRFNTFLLDKDNKIILIGSPANNEKLWVLYKEQIKKMVNS